MSAEDLLSQSAERTTEPSCGSCRFAEPIIGDDEQPRLECRRYPVNLFVLDDQVSQAWPTIYPGDWCGEYEAQRS